MRIKSCKIIAGGCNMKNKKLLMTIVIMLLVITMSSMLLACTTTSKPPQFNESNDDDNIFENDDIMLSCTIHQMLQLVTSGLDLKNLTMRAGSQFNLGGINYDFSVAANIGGQGGQLALDLRSQDKLKLGFYISEGKLYAKTGDLQTVQIVNINFDAIEQLLTKYQKQALSDSKNIPIESIINLIISLAFDKPTVTTYDGGFNLATVFNLNSILSLGSNLIGAFDFPYKEYVKSLLDVLNKEVPPVRINFEVDFDNHKYVKGAYLKVLDDNVDSENYGKPILTFDSQINLGSQNVNVILPPDIALASQFSLTRLMLDGEITLDAKNSAGIDLGSIINKLANQQIFPPSMLTLTADKKYQLEAKIDLDVFSSDNIDDSIFSVQLRAGNAEMLNLNYHQGVLYVSAFSKQLAAVKLNLFGQLKDLKNIDALGKLIEYYPIGEDNRALAILSLSNENELDLLGRFMQIVGLENNVYLESNQLSILVDSYFISKLEQLINSEIPLNLAQGESIFSRINFFEGGVSSFEVGYKSNEFDLNFGSTQILYGHQIVGLEELTLNAIGDKDAYAYDSQEIIKNLVSKFSIKGSMVVNSAVGEVDFLKFINSILNVLGKQQLQIPITLKTGAFGGKLNYDISWDLDFDQPANSKVYAQITDKDGRVILGLYVQEGQSYIDASGLGLVRFGIKNVDVVSLISDVLFPKKQEIVLKNMSQAYAMGGNNLIQQAAFNSVVTQIVQVLSQHMQLSMDINFADENIMAQLSAFNMSIGVSGKFELDYIFDKDMQFLDSFSIVDALNQVTLIGSILEHQNLDLRLETLQSNVDVKDAHTKITLRKAVAQEQGFETLPNGLQAPYNSIVVTIYDGWGEQHLDNKALVYIVLDVQGDMLLARGTKHWFNINLIITQISGEIVDLQIPFEIKKLLQDLVAPLFGESGGEGGGDIGQAVQVINSVLVELSSWGQVNVNLDMNAATISDIIFQAIKGVFTDMNLESITGGQELVTIEYNNTQKGVFANQLFDKLIKPAISNSVGSLAGSASVLLKGKVLELVSRFLPIGNFANMNARISIEQGKLVYACIIANGIVNSSGYEDLLELHLYNEYAIKNVA